MNAAIAHRAFRYFIDETDPHTGLTKDRAALNAGDHYTVASVAATGYALTALPIGVENGWISREHARRRALVTLRFLEDRMPQVHGWYYHFVDMRTGQRVWKCELSSIDTALLLAGAIAVGQYWPHSELSQRVDRLLARVDWRWMLTDGGAKPAELTLCMGWKPESGFLQSRWSSYCELMLLYLEGLGTPRHPLPSASWSAWKREVVKNEGYDVIAPGPIFMHQMSQGYVDLRNQRDRLGYDYWQNSVNAHRANAAFCARHEKEFASYRGGIWGLNASDTPDGYGTREPRVGRHDGTICPSGAVAGLPFVPGLSECAITEIYDRYHDHIWGRYGFADAYNADRSWWDPDVIGIDLGMALVSLEDARSGFVWRLMARSPILRRGLRAAGFHRTHEPPLRPVLRPPVPTRRGEAPERPASGASPARRLQPLIGWRAARFDRSTKGESLHGTRGGFIVSFLGEENPAALFPRDRKPAALHHGGPDESTHSSIAELGAGAGRGTDRHHRHLAGADQPALHCAEPAVASACGSQPLG